MFINREMFKWVCIPQGVCLVEEDDTCEGEERCFKRKGCLLMEGGW